MFQENQPRSVQRREKHGRASETKTKTKNVTTGKRSKARWKTEPDEHDYPAAFNYLSLLMRSELAERVVQALQSTEETTRKASDLLRPVTLLLPETNPDVACDLKKVKRGEALSPVLLVRDDVAKGRPLIVADGYHRICASTNIDDTLAIPCRIADLPAR